MKAFGSTESFSMRVLSPMMLPPDSWLLGSIASTAMRWPAAVSSEPSASMKVLFHTPGTPVMPIRTALPVWGRRRSMTSSAFRLCEAS